MRFLIALLASAMAAPAAPPSLDHLFSRPLPWGTSPDQLSWSKKGHTLVFLWNAEGRRFKDLYAYHPDRQNLVRLTDLEKQTDELNLTDAEKDDRLRRYLLPEIGLGSFDLSEDGSRVAFSWRNDLWIANTTGDKPPLRLTHTKIPETQPQFSPDGTQLASIRGGQVIVQDLSTGQIWQSTDVENATLTGYRWSPDGKQFVYSIRRGPARQLPIMVYSGRFVATRNIPRTVAGDESNESALFVVPSEGGKPQQIDLGPGPLRGSASLPEWSRDSKKLVLIHFQPDWKKKQIVVIDAHTLKAKSVSEESDPRWVDYGYAGWSPDSKTVFFTSERDGWAHLYTVAAEGGTAKQLTKGQWEIHKDTFSENPQWVGEWLYFSSTEGDTAQRQTYRIRSDGADKEKLSSQEGLNLGVISEDGKHFAWLRADSKNPTDLWVDDHRVTKSPQPEFYTMSWPERKYLHYLSRGDKQTIAARMMLPPAYREGDGKKWPAVVYVHGSGYATSVLKQWGSYMDYRYAYNTFLANHGYVIFEMDYRGSTGYGRDWRAGVYLNMGGPDLDDVLGGVDYLRSLKNIDMDRVGIWGVSYGGFMTDMAMFKAPGVFKAGAAWAAVNDWENYNAGYTAQRLNTPDKNPEAYRRSSPIYFSNNLKDHLLIVHGMVDDNVLFQDAVQLTEKLIHEGKDFSHIYYPQESHGFVRDETWLDALRRTTEWFDRYLR
jgi:dipeptidyl aminopeptidase/acylaminoacyl peptidase